MESTTEVASSTGNILPCSAIVFRAVLRPGWVDKDSGKVMPAAFFRRHPPKDTLGISVGHSCDVQSYLRQFNKSHGAMTLHVGRIRDVGLDVIPDGPTGIPCHAVITGAPYPGDDTLRAESLALDLARQARLLAPQPPDVT